MYDEDEVDKVGNNFYIFHNAVSEKVNNFVNVNL